MRINKKAAAVAVAAVTLAGVGTAYAYWTTTGSGAGSATTSSGANAQLKVNQLLAPATTDLAPGHAVGAALTGDVTNLTGGTSGIAPVSYQLTGIKIDLAVVKAVGAPAGPCDASDYLLASANSLAAYATSGTAGSKTGTMSLALNTSPTELAADTTGAAWTAGLAFVNSSTNQDGCKGAKVNLTYTTLQS